MKREKLKAKRKNKEEKVKKKMIILKWKNNAVKRNGLKKENLQL